MTFFPFWGANCSFKHQITWIIYIIHTVGLGDLTWGEDWSEIERHEERCERGEDKWPRSRGSTSYTWVCALNRWRLGSIALRKRERKNTDRISRTRLNSPGERRKTLTWVMSAVSEEMWKASHWINTHRNRFKTSLRKGDGCNFLGWNTLFSFLALYVERAIF